VELLIEEAGRNGAELAQRVIERLMTDRERELIRRNVLASVDSTPHSE
jgi:hypothetical protein